MLQVLMYSSKLRYEIKSRSNVLSVCQGDNLKGVSSVIRMVKRNDLIWKLYSGKDVNERINDSTLIWIGQAERKGESRLAKLMYECVCVGN